MKHTYQTLNQSPANALRLQVEIRQPSPSASPNGLPRLTLGGAICGSFAGSFVGALLGVTIGLVCHDISLGLDGALLGSIIASVAGAIYGFFLALRERKHAPHSEEADA